MQTNMYRQGDVLVTRTDLTTIPNEAERVKLDRNRVVLAYGEVTGHAHVIPGRHASMYRWQGDVLVEVRQETALRHEEHAAIPLVPGIYRVTRQREYRPEAPVWVAD